MLKKGDTIGIFSSSCPITAIAPEATESTVSFLEVLEGRKLPILAEIDCCHTIPMMTLPLGGRIRMDGEKQEITILKIFDFRKNFKQTTFFYKNPRFTGV